MSLFKMAVAALVLAMVSSVASAQPHTYVVIGAGPPRPVNTEGGDVYLVRPNRAYAYGYFGANPPRPAGRSFRTYRNYTRHPGR